ncbi:MAG: TrmH family RNA methyltransferase [Solirubrobacterales bacterium]
MITSPSNDKLTLIRKLAQRKHRGRERLFVAEGEDLVAAATAAGVEPMALLCRAGSGLAGDEVEPELLDGVSTLGSGTRTIGVYRHAWAMETPQPWIYLAGISDPGNVGAIIRSAQALVGGTVAIGPGTADPYGPKAVRASMGAIFAQPLVRADLADTPSPRMALTAHAGTPLADIDERPATVCLGSERDGLPEGAEQDCELHGRIEQRPDAVESLNVAAAAAITMQWLAAGPAAPRTHA